MFVVWPRSKGKLFFQKEKKMLKTQASVVARPVSAVCPLGAQSLCLCLWFLILTSESRGTLRLLPALSA